jgi:hypothetical protein
MSRSFIRTLIVVGAIVLAAFAAMGVINAHAYSASPQGPWALLPGGTPTVSGSVAAPNGGADDANEADGQELVGSVASLDPTHGTFALSTSDGRTLTVAMTTQTAFDNTLASPASLQTGMNVDVEGAPQADGSILASEVGLQDQSEQGEQPDQNDTGVDSGD